jgi:hypothetical protein
MKFLIALAVLAGSVPAVAAPDNKSADSPQPRADAPKKERKICRREETSVGLYGSRSVCLTAAEWRVRDHSSEDLDPRAAGNGR